MIHSPRSVTSVVDHLRSSCGLRIVAVWCSFLAYSLLRAPIPAVNEPHYLIKARHYWQPDWCGGDLFLESSNPHLVFYQTVGWLTSVCSLETAALVGRVLVLLVLAIGWDRLVSQLVAGRWASLAVAWLFLLLQACGNFAGEWLIGGVESKVIAYGLVMWGCGALLQGRLKIAGALLGASVSFHPVVGLWCLIGLAGAFVLLTIRDRRSPSPPAQCRSPQRLKRPALALLIAVICSLPGLIPAATLLGSHDPATSLRADIIQVGIRLDHHLDPLMFPWTSYAYYAAMLILWLLLRRWTPVSPARRWLDAFTWMAVAIAVCGWIAAAGPRPITHLPLLAWRLKLLKLYPFRIVDLLLPFALAVTLIQWFVTRFSPAPTRGNRTTIAVGFACIYITSLLIPTVDRNPSRMSRQAKSDWIAALRWIAAETPQDTLLWTPDEDWAVKWFAERPEYVNFKDCPQDSAGIVEWYRRRVWLAKWKRAAAQDGLFTAEELQQVHAETGTTHLVVSRMGPIAAAPVYRNDSFRIYDLRRLPAE